MKKIFLTTILVLLALSILANEMDNITAPMIAPSYGINIEQLKLYTTPETAEAVFTLPQEPIANTTYYNHWAMTDFPEAPFDGTLDLYVVGSPLPSPLATLIAAIGSVGIICMCKLQSTKRTSRSALN